MVLLEWLCYNKRTENPACCRGVQWENSFVPRTNRRGRAGRTIARLLWPGACRFPLFRLRKATVMSARRMIE